MFPIASKQYRKLLDEMIVGKEYVRCAKDFTKDCGFTLLDSSKMSDDEIHTNFVRPFINALSQNIKQRFNDKTKMCNATSILIPGNVPNDDISYGV